MIAIGSASIVTMVLAEKLNPQPDGSVTVTFPRGASTVLSVQPDGRFETRPAGTSGPFERAILTPQGLVFSPTSAVAFLVPYVPKVPNS